MSVRKRRKSPAFRSRVINIKVEVAEKVEDGPYRAFDQVEAYRQMDMERSFCACNNLHYCNPYYQTRY